MRAIENTPEPAEYSGDRLSRLEERIRRLEEHLGIADALPPNVPAAQPPAALSPVFGGSRKRGGESLELRLGQHWFALSGVAILTAGLAFLVSLPYPALPSILPAGAGGVLGLVLVWLGHRWPRLFSGAGPALHAAAFILFGFAALRIFFFGPRPALPLESLPALVLLVGVLVLNTTLAVRQHSPLLIGLALAIGCVMALVNGSMALVALSLLIVAAVALWQGGTRSPGLLIAGALLSHATYFLWAAGNPVRGGGLHFVREPAWAPAAFLVVVLAFGAAPLLRSRAPESLGQNIAALVNCAFGYGAFLIHTAAIQTHFALLHLTAAGALIGLALACFVRRHSRISTFFLAMTGYVALTMAIIKLSDPPEVFVWLSAQSLVVVATAIGFRSRFIVVGNFFIFAAIVASYVVVTDRETGISIGFGVVALATARILAWKQHRLELRTEFMRNAYLASAFVIFPYSAYHLFPARLVALAWVGLAGLYYLASLTLRNRKYRWMGHGTLVLTTLFVTGTAISQFEPAYRVVSFLVLGAALLTVSLLLARSRRRNAMDRAQETPRPPASN